MTLPAPGAWWTNPLKRCAGWLENSGHRMKSKLSRFSSTYRAGLRGYLRGNSDLKPARALGRQAAAIRLEMLEIARIHEHSLGAEVDFAKLSGPGPVVRSRAGLIKRAGSFFAEVILPIEGNHRGAREA